MFSLSRPIWEDLPQIKCQASVNLRFTSWTIFPCRSCRYKAKVSKRMIAGQCLYPLRVQEGNERHLLSSHWICQRHAKINVGLAPKTTQQVVHVSYIYFVNVTCAPWIGVLLCSCFLPPAFAKRVDFCSFATASNTFVRCTLGGCHGAHLRWSKRTMVIYIHLP